MLLLLRAKMDQSAKELQDKVIVYQEKCGTMPEIDLEGPFPGRADCEVE